MIPGEIQVQPGDIPLNTGRATLTVTVANHGDRPVQVGSHYHFYEVNDALVFDREPTRGYRLGIAAGFWILLSLVLVLRIRSLLKGHPEPFPLSRQVLADDLRSLKEDLERERNSES